MEAREARAQLDGELLHVVVAERYKAHLVGTTATGSLDKLRTRAIAQRAVGLRDDVAGERHALGELIEVDAAEHLRRNLAGAECLAHGALGRHISGSRSRRRTARWRYGAAGRLPMPPWRTTRQ